VREQADDDIVALLNRYFTDVAEGAVQCEHGLRVPVAGLHGPDHQVLVREHGCEKKLGKPRAQHTTRAAMSSTKGGSERRSS